GADDEEISEGGIPRVIVLGYDGLPMHPVASPSLDYIPGPKDPQTPPVPQDEDEADEQPLPPVDFTYVLSHPENVTKPIPRGSEDMRIEETDENVRSTILWTWEMIEMMMMAILWG
ncbi:hypothetical protein Tco_1220843, partial [Tanacetum coccineum]